jgi:hypothetical protein
MEGSQLSSFSINSLLEEFGYYNKEFNEIKKELENTKKELEETKKKLFIAESQANMFRNKFKRAIRERNSYKYYY